MRDPVKNYGNGNEKQKLENLEILLIIMRKIDDSSPGEK